MAVVYDDPGALTITAEGGYATKHIWRGIDLAQFTSFNHLDVSGLPKADSDVCFVGASANYQGFSFGLKYITTLDDGFNPFFAPLTTTLDNYSEIDLSVTYTRMLIGNDLLEGTAGLDFYYYPNGEFWGVDHQGMAYLRFSSPHLKWAQPFVELFYNFSTDGSANGLADQEPKGPWDTFRGATASELVEGGGFQLGVQGGDRIWNNDMVSIAATYSVSTIFKNGYAFEDDGFSHLSLTTGMPVTIGRNFTITPSVSYVYAFGDIEPKSGAKFPGGGAQEEIWNDPGWVFAVKGSWQF